VFCLYLLSVCDAWSDERDALKGQKHIAVEVNPVDPELEPYGVTVQQLKTDTELRLRGAGIDVSKQYSSALFITITSVRSRASSGLYAYSAQVQFRISVIRFIDVVSALGGPDTKFIGEPIAQAMQVPLANVSRMENSTFMASIWQKAFTGLVGANNVSLVRNDVKDLVDEFLNDWLAVNPRQ
jgi:hypothetical protein